MKAKGAKKSVKDDKKDSKKAKGKAGSAEQKENSPETTAAANTESNPDIIIITQDMAEQNGPEVQQEVGGELNREQLW